MFFSSAQRLDLFTWCVRRSPPFGSFFERT